MAAAAAASEQKKCYLGNYETFMASADFVQFSFANGRKIIRLSKIVFIWLLPSLVKKLEYRIFNLVDWCD